MNVMRRAKFDSGSTEATWMDDQELSVQESTLTCMDAEATATSTSSSKPKTKKKAHTIGDSCPRPPGKGTSKSFMKRRSRQAGAGESISPSTRSDKRGSDDQRGSSAPAEALEALPKEANMLKHEAAKTEEPMAAPKIKAATIGEMDVGEGGSKDDPLGEQSADWDGLLPQPPASPRKGRRHRGHGRHRTSTLHPATGQGSTGSSDQRPPACNDRRLSFAMLSMSDIWNAIREELPHMDWMAEFWEVALRAPYPAACKTLALRSLSYWVTVYNKWQALGGWRPGNAPEFFTACQAQEILGIPSMRVVELAQLFGGAGEPESGMVHLPAAALMVVCVLMSNVVSKRQKVRFLLGLFDDQDEQRFDTSRFSKMMLALYHGIAAMFGLPADGQVERIQTFASCLYRRILNFLEVQKGEMLDQSTPLPFSVIEEWLMGHDDPLNLPLILFMERFSVDEEDPERFEDESHRFRLSHRHPVSLPLETAMSLESGTFLTRHEVIVVDKIFSHCLSIGTYDISYGDAEELLAGHGLHLKLVDLWIGRLHPALDRIQESRGVVTLSSLFKQLCPKATVRHLRMFQSWIKEYEEMESLKKEVLEVNQVLIDWCRQDDGKTTSRHLPLESDPRVDRVISEFLERYLKRQEEQLASTRRLFATDTVPVEMAPAPAARFLKAKVPEETRRSWNAVLDLLEVHGAGTEEDLRSSRFLPLDVRNLLIRLMSKDAVFHRVRFLKMLCEIFNYRHFN